MNICFVYKHFPIEGNFDSGIGKYLRDLTSELTKKHNIIILTTSKKLKVVKSKNLTIYSIPYPNNKRRSIVFIKHLVNVARTLPYLIKKHKIQIIEFANWECEGLLFTLFPNRIFKIPVVIRLHTPSFVDHSLENRPKYFSEKLTEACEKMFVNQNTNFLTTSTKFNAKECTKGYGIKKNIEIIPLGIKLKKTIHRSPFTVHRSLSILYVGRLEKRKGIDILIKAIPTVLSKVRNLKFIIAGRENNNYEWVNELRNSIPYKYLGNVNFLGYVNNQKRINQLYQDSDICVYPARYESFGLTILEAMNFGKAVIAGGTGGIPEVIDDNINGVLINNADYRDLARSIITLCKNPEEIKRLGKNAKTKVRNKFEAKMMTVNTAIYFNRLIGK